MKRWRTLVLFAGALFLAACDVPAVDGDAASHDLATQEGAASIPKLLCPLASCTQSGFGFGSTWTYNRCPQKLSNGQAGPYKKHTGVDLKASAGTVVKASAAGTVKLVYSAGAGWGSAILVEHKDASGAAYVTQYMHVNSSVSTGATVKAGQKLGTIAAITSPHLHFAVWNAPYASTAQRGALPNCSVSGACSNGTCFDGKYTDPAWPSKFVNPLSYL
ncbi:MAG: hypothetical protein AMXMBFR64_54570 [Myxococcales bacterium]